MATQTMLTIAELAKHLQVSTLTVRRMVKDGRIKSVQVGRNIRIPAAELTRIEEHGVKSKMTTETQPPDNTIDCPRCDHAFNNIDQSFDCAQIVCPDCATGFTWHREMQPRAVTVACTAEDMSLELLTAHEYHAANLRAAWESTDPEWLYTAVMSAATFLDKLAQIEHQTVKGPLPGQEIKPADLDALPQGAVILDNTGDYWEKQNGEWDLYQHLPSAEISEEYAPFTYVTTL